MHGENATTPVVVRPVHIVHITFAGRAVNLTGGTAGLAGLELSLYSTDGVDGAYRITQGAWGGRAAGAASGVELGWIEEYDEGFRVAVRGRYDAADGTIKARFTSSRGVSGTFVLAPKPSIF